MKIVNKNFIQSVISDNIFIGTGAGYNITTGKNNLSIGPSTDVPSNVMKHQMSFDNRIIYLEFGTSHTKSDVYKCLRKYMPTTRTHIACMGFYGTYDVRLARCNESNKITLYNYNANTSWEFTKSSSDQSTYLTTDLIIMFPNANPTGDSITRNNVRPTDIS